MGLKKETFTPEESLENLLIKNVQKFTNVNRELKIIDIHEDVLNKLDQTQKLYLDALKKHKYSLQYTIK